MVCPDAFSGQTFLKINNMLKVLFCFCTLCVLISCGQKAPTDVEVKDWYRGLYDSWSNAEGDEAKQKVLAEMTRQAEAAWAVGEMSEAQIEYCLKAGDYDLVNGLKVWLAPVFEKKAEKEGLAGAEAAYIAWRFLPQEVSKTERQKNRRLWAYRRVLSHSGWQELAAARPEVLTGMLEDVSGFSGMDLVDDDGVMEMLLAVLDQELPAEAVKASLTIFETLDRDTHVPPDVKESVRKKVLKQYIRLLESGEIEGKRRIAELKNTVHYLEGPYAKGELVGYAAPQLDFIWWSCGNEKTLADLKGKVVMLDFWGTKCAPCISIFPEMRNLVTYYKGYPVEIIGIVSLQGYHVDVKNNRTIRTNGKPEEEMELMRTFMEDMDMTWRVAFTKQPVFNTDFGVKSIPHVAIIDASGAVRYNALDPFEEFAAKTERIDGLLREAGLPCPGVR